MHRVHASALWRTQRRPRASPSPPANRAWWQRSLRLVNAVTVVAYHAGYRTLQYRVQKPGNNVGRQLASMDGVSRRLAGSLVHVRPPVAIVDLVAEESKHSDLNPTAGDANGDHGHERIAALRP